MRRHVNLYWLLAAALLAATWATLGPPDCLAAELTAPTPTAALIDPPRWEVRLGAFAHGVGSIEEGTVALNPELVLPRLPFGQDEWWAILVPRPHVGGMINVSGKTSYVYGGALWTLPLWYGFFAEGFFGGAVHNGSLLGEPGRVALGCNPVFHVGGSLGYSLSPRWHIMATFDHISNGNSVFGTDCVKNQGLNQWGARLGFSF
jgi:hypothetical protein